MGTNRWRSRRRHRVAAAIAAALLIAAACGDDAPQTESEDAPLSEQFPFAAEMGAKVFEQTGADVPEDVQVCVGGELLSTFGTERAEALMELEFKDQPEAEFLLVARIFDECVPGATLAASMISSTSEIFQQNAPGTRAVECVGEQIDGRVGAILEELVISQKTEALPQQMMVVLDTCTPPEDLNALLQTLFVDQGASPPQAACAGKRLSDEYSFRDIIEGFAGGFGSDIEAGISAILNECLTAADEEAPGGAP